MTLAATQVQDAVRAGGISVLDARGLMPLARARALLGSTTVFARGEGVSVGAQYVLDSDTLWAALLSLQDAAEFVAAASRITWEFHPRGFDNVDLHLRYGDAIVPWLETFLDASGTLRNVPWCVLPCLLACGDEAAFDLVWRVRRVEGGASDVARTWIDRHPDVAARCLTARRTSDARARAHLAGLCLRGHPAPNEPIADAASPLSEEQILAWLDACALGLPPGRALCWPRAMLAAGGALPACRAVAARDGDAWGRALERVEGSRPGGVDAACVRVYAFGTRVAGGTRQYARPLASCGDSTSPAAFAAWLRECARSDLDALLGPPASSLGVLGIAHTRAIVAVLAHTPPLAPQQSPSASPSYQALARALGSR